MASESGLFSGYVETVPFDRAFLVLSDKRQRFEKGYAEVQNAIDTISSIGSEIVKPEAKKYFQKRLRDIGNQITALSVADLSNVQVSSILSRTAKSVADDRIVRNAIISTKRIKEGDALMSKEIEEGKASQDNVMYWEYLKSQYLNSGKIDDIFSHSYFKTIDVGAKLLEIAQKVPEVETVEEMPYKRDANGEIIYDERTNAPIIDEVLLRETKKGKSASKLYDYFLASLTESELQQLRIHAWARYKTNGPSVVESDVNSLYSEREKILRNRLVEISSALASDIKESEKQKLYTEIEKVKNSIRNLEDEKKQIITGVYSKPTEKELISAYSSIYTTRFLSEKANQMAYQSVKSEIEENPYFKARMDLWKYELDIKKYELDYNKYLLSLKEFEYKVLSDSEDSEENSKKDSSKNKGVYIVSGSDKTIGDPLKYLSDRNKESEEAVNNFIAKTYSQIVKGHEDMSAEEIKAAYRNIYTNWLQNPESIKDPDKILTLKTFGQLVEISSSLGTISKKANDILKEGLKKADESVPNFNFQGENYSFSEVYTILEDLKDKIKNRLEFKVVPRGSFSSDYYAPFEESKKEEFLKDYSNNPKAYKFAAYVLDNVDKRWYGHEGGIRLSKSITEAGEKPTSESSDRELELELISASKDLKKYVQEADKVKKNVLREYKEKASSLVKEKVEVFLPAYYGFNDELLKGMKSFAKTVLQKFEKDKFEDPVTKKIHSVSTISQNLNKEEYKDVYFYRVPNQIGGKSSNYIVVGDAHFPLDDDDTLRNIPEELTREISYPEIRYAISSNGYTTNTSGKKYDEPGAPYTAYIQNPHLYSPELTNSKYKDLVRYDITKSVTSDKAFNYVIYVYDTNRRKWVTVIGKNLRDLDSTVKSLSKVTPEYLDNVIKEASKKE